MNIWRTKPKLFTGLLIVGIACLATAIYSNTFYSPFVFDDLHSIVRNPKIKDISHFLTWKAITYPRVLVDFTFALNYYFGELNVFGYHLVNLLIHIINGILVYFLALNILTHLVPASQSAIRNSQFAIRNSQSAILLSFFTALIFITHPIQTQAVTYIVQRYTSMAAMFYLAAVLFFILGRKLQIHNLIHKALIFFVLTGICAICAFLSKQNTASLPAAILLVEYILFDRSWAGWKKKLKWIVPACAVFLVFIFYVLILKGNVNFGRLLEDVSTKTRDISGISRWEYLCTQFNVLVIYIRLLFFPVGQSVDYMYPFKSGFFDGLTPLAFLFLLGLVAASFWQRNKRPVITLAILWFFITLSVESSIFPIRDALFEHRLYLPIFGFALLISWFVSWIVQSKVRWNLIVIPVVILCLSVATFQRNQVWQHPVDLWFDALAQNPKNHRVHNNLGYALDKQKKFKRAIQHYQKALDIYPRYADAHLNFGLALAKTGHLDKAIAHFSKAAELEPKLAKAHFNLALAMQMRGKLHKAQIHYQKALKIRPEYLQAHLNLSNIMAQKNEYQKAIEHLEKVLQIDSKHFDALLNLGTLFYMQGDFDNALKKINRALQINSNSTEALTNKGIILMRQNRLQEAIKSFTKVLKLDPNNKKARSLLQKIMFSMGRGSNLSP